MSVLESALSYVYKQWYGAEMFSSSWRAVNWDKKSDIQQDVKNITPSNPDIRNLRILLYGPIGAGKSSFINSLSSVFQGRVSNKANVATGATSCTKVYKGYQIKSSTTEALPVTIFDFMGLEGTTQNVHPDDLKNALHGHLPDGYKFDPANPLSSDDPRYISNPSNGEKPHCVVCVVSGNTISQMHEDIIRQMKKFLKEARQLGIPQAVIMTMSDEVCPAVKKDLKTIYRSETIKKKMYKCSDILKIPMTCIFPVKNYHEESDTNNDIDVLLLLALKQIAHFANDYTADL